MREIAPARRAVALPGGQARGGGQEQEGESGGERPSGTHAPHDIEAGAPLRNSFLPSYTPPVLWKKLFGRGADEAPREAGLPPAGGVPDERLGPEPPPPRSANRPGVTVHAVTAESAIAGPGPTPARPGASKLGAVGGAPLDRGLSWAAVVLSGPAHGDVVVAPEGVLDLPDGTMVLLEGLSEGDAGTPPRISRDALTGTGLPGIAGARVLARTPSRSILRLGPPPAARWAVVGLRSVAVLKGKLTLIDGDEGFDVWAGHVAFVADPTATLYIQAGNDTAVAIAFAVPEVLVRLG